MVNRIKWFPFSLLFFIFVIFPMASAHAQNEVPTVIKGEIDLRDQPTNSIDLSGQWEFYWKQLLTPEQINNEKPKKTYISVPQQWINTSIGGEQLPTFGYATYRVKLLMSVDDIGKVKAISLPNIASSYRIWVDGHLLTEVGIVGKTDKEELPMNSSITVSFPVKTKEVEIVIQVSNFSQRKAGIWDNVVFGEHHEVVKESQRDYILTSFLIGSLFIIGIYHLVMYLKRKRDVTFLYFSMTCLAIAMRMFFLEGYVSSVYFPVLPWEIEVKIEYLGAFLGVSYFYHYIYYFFGVGHRKSVLTFVTAIHILLSLLVIFTPASIYTFVFVYYSIVLILIFLSLVIISFKALYANTSFSKWNFMAISILFLCIVNDSLYYLNFLQTRDMTPFGLFFYLFVQAILLSASISDSFNREENMKHQLEAINLNLESIVKDRTKELVKVNNQLQKELDNRMQLISSISHEMRSPLTTIKGYTRGFIDGIFKVENKDKLQTIYSETGFMERMLDDLFELSLLELGKLNFYFENKEPIAYFERLYEKYNFEVKQAGLAFHLTIDSFPNVEVKIDPIRLEQVFVNLLRNALRNTKEGSISLHLSSDNNVVMLSVNDTGAGIEPEILPKIFSKFIKGNNENNYKSTGIGLAICKEILNAHGGNIKVQSMLGEGSTFTIKLPVVDKL